MHKVIVDMNVIISGIVFGGTPRKIIELWLRKTYIFCLSPELKSEVLSKLQQKFLLPEHSIKDLEETLDTYSKKYIPQRKLTLCEDPNDNFLLELAEESKATYLVSGDKLVLKMKNYKTTTIISPKEFIDILS